MFVYRKKIIQMITNVSKTDADKITAIYNYYVRTSVVTFDTEEWSVEKMTRRIEALSEKYPYIVFRMPDGNIAGYCYAHPWKERAAYGHTLETTVYLSPLGQNKGLGRELMLRLIEECRRQGYRALIACITGNNEASRAFHARLGFEQVSLFKEVGHKFGQWLDVVDYELLLAPQTASDPTESATLKF